MNVITITLGTPKAHQAPSFQTAVVNHVVEQPLGVVEDSVSLYAYRMMSMNVILILYYYTIVIIITY